MKKTFYLAVAGTMGVGKTTAARFLAEKLQAHLLEENFGENQFLPRFYQEMSRWAFHSQTFFLLEKIKQTLETKRFLLAGQLIIQDTPLIQDVQSYAKAQFVLGNMDEAEFTLYTKIYAMFVKKIPKPDLIVYLDASIPTILKRVNRRQRGFEAKVPRPYIQLLDKLNRQWVRKLDHAKVLRLKTDKLDLVANQEDIDRFIEIVKTKIGFPEDPTNGQIKALSEAQAILMCGLPGSGKSTIAKHLSRSLSAQLLSSDTIRERVFKSLRYDSLGDLAVLKLRPKYHTVLIEEASEHLLRGKRVVVDASNMDEQRVKLIKEFGKVIDKKLIAVVVVKTPKEIISQRMKKIKGMANDREDFYTAWRRVYGYYEKHLTDKSYFWPTNQEGVKILEIINN